MIEKTTIMANNTNASALARPKLEIAKGGQVDKLYDGHGRVDWATAGHDIHPLEDLDSAIV